MARSRRCPGASLAEEPVCMFVVSVCSTTFHHGGFMPSDADQPEADVQRRLDLAACGMDCTQCEIRLAPHDPEIAGSLVCWFRDHGYPEAEPGWFHCGGCFGGLESHWSADCPIMRCCAMERKLSSCAECPDFPCELILEFEQDGMPHHATAIARLRRMLDGSGTG